ncbi:efflux RND transporter periplasmic adaptor subunit [Ekhidna sp. To15]|uniref:efflux RND transporter periplasmic adaptor subunit n=1 Tax=Ekhidna sp. To15 TaxID=3395267 RepID=UPI003F527486
MKRNNKIALIGGAAAIALLVFVLSGSSSDATAEVVVDVEQGDFVVDIMTSGSLDAKNSVPIKGPTGLRNYRIWNVTIQHIIDEGTEVTEGQYVARLDPSELTGKIKDAQLEVDETQSQFTQTRLDTALTMRQARDELINLGYTVREKQLTLDQSQFEPPATIQKAEIELEKAKRSLQQAKENYEIKRQQNVAKMQEASAELRGDKNELEGLMELSKSFTILAPQSGMLIYERSWDGKPVKAGSQVSAWDPTVATLPDLSKMLSKTYVNEVDIRKVKAGQSVEIGFDAFPDKNLKGRVTKVANVGEQRPNSDAKVFEVEIEVFGTDPLLKPGMTTSNKIITKTVEDALFVPLESLHSQYDSITYVFKKSGGSSVKQEVIIGDANAENVHIIAGLDAEDRVSLSSIQGMEKDEVNLLPEMNGKRNKKEEIIEEPEPTTPQGPQRRRRRD